MGDSHKNMRKHVLAVFLIAASVLLAYSSSLTNTWIMDDVFINKPISINDIDDLLGFRKVAYATFLMNQLITPFTPVSFRIFNILLHILNVILIYFLALMTVTLKSSDSGLHKNNVIKSNKSLLLTSHNAFCIAVLSSAIFALHPININAVAYIVQRMASLSTLFVLLSLLSYITARRSTTRSRAVLLYILSGICIVIGIFSKENAVMAVPLILLYDYVFLSEFNRRKFLKISSIITGIGIVSFVFVSYFLNLHTVVIELSEYFVDFNNPLTKKGWMAVDVSWTPLQHFLTEFRVISRYLFLLLLPLPQFLVFDWSGYPVSQGIIEPLTTLFSMIVVVSLIFFALMKMRRYPFLCFGILWYFIAISLESFFALGSDLYFEHRNYLPFSGLIIGIIGHVMTLDTITVKDRALWTVVIAVCLILGLLTFTRNLVWKDSMTLWKDTIKKTPLNYRAHTNLGFAYESQDLIDKAIEHYRIATELNHDYVTAYYNLGHAYQSQGFIDKAIKNYQIAVELNPSMSEAHNNLGNAFKFQGMFDRAIEHFEIAIDLSPDVTTPYLNLGNIFLSQGLIDRAINHYKIAIKLNQKIPALHYNLAKAYKSQNSIDEAIEHYKTAIKLKQDFPEAHINLGNIFLSQGLIDRAIDHYKIAIQLSPNIPEAHINLGLAYKSKGLIDRANKHFNIARRLRPEIFRSGNAEY
jgi:tetratricopeptide (TPR) repeat protein